MKKRSYLKPAAGIVFFLLIASSGCRTSPPQTQIVEEFQDFSGQRYKISFLAYDRGTSIEGKKSLAGHASVAIDDSDIWGFYPSIRGRFITKNGILRFSTESPEIHESATFFVDTFIFDDIMNLINDWVDKPPAFNIPFLDCVTFIYRVCDIIGLKYNNLAVLPVSAVRSISRRNEQNLFYKRVLRE
jgi:hypothetical protein